MCEQEDESKEEREKDKSSMTSWYGMGGDMNDE